MPEDITEEEEYSGESDTQEEPSAGETEENEGTDAAGTEEVDGIPLLQRTEPVTWKLPMICRIC